MDSGFPGQQLDWTSLLTMLKSDDSMDVYQGAMTLQNQLQFAQENSMSGFQTEQYMDILVKIISRDPITDLCNEVKFFSIQCVTSLMDIFPSLCNSLVNAGLVKGLTNALKNCVGFIELAEACIKALEKVVIENPPAILKSGAVECIIHQMDFFVVSTQQRIYKIIQKIARHSSTEADFDQFIMPLMTFICINLSLDMDGDQKKLEDVSKIVCELQESFCIFYSPIQDFSKVGAQYDKLLDIGVYEIILTHIRQVSEVNARIQLEKAYQDGDGDTNNGSSLNIEDAGMLIDGQINSKNNNQVLTNLTLLNLFKIMENGCRYSCKVSNKLFGQSSLIKDLATFLPNDFAGKKKQYNSDDFPFIMEVIKLLNSVFSDQGTSQSVQQQSLNKELINHDLDNPQQRILQVKKDFENKKREYQVDQSNMERIVEVAQNLLPRIFFVYESIINPSFRIKTLQLIDKIIAIFDEELLRNFIEPKQFANFIYSIIKAKHSQSTEAALKMTKRVLDSSPMNYSVPFIREGVSQLIKGISSEEKFKAYMGIEKKVDIKDNGFDMDIYEVKEALLLTRQYNPEDYASKDYYERRLLQLVEQQKAAQANDKRAKAKGEDEKMADNSKDQPRINSALKIIQQSSQIMTEYFENTQFIGKLKEQSPVLKNQLEILSELTDLSNQLCLEATHVQSSVEEMDTIKKIMKKVADLLTLEAYEITSYELRNSDLLFALEVMLTMTPSQAKILIQKKKSEEKGEEMKHSEEIELMEQQKQSKQVSKKDSRCLIYRLKLFAHVLLIKKNEKSLCPMRVLIDLNHKIISENDSFLITGTSIQNSQSLPQGHERFGGGFGGGLSNIFSQIQTGQYGDYDHCINALKQLQRPVTVNLIYDSKKTFLNKEVPISFFAQQKRQNQKTLKQVMLSKEDQALIDSDEGEDEGAENKKENDLIMDDHTEQSVKDKILSFEVKYDENMPETDFKIDDDEDEMLSKMMPPEMKKGFSCHPAMSKIGASPYKDKNAFQLQKLNESKVFMKRHYLYSQLKQIPVHVEQSSCIQVLEDFLRNRIKNVGQVKSLKYDYGFGGPGSNSRSGFSDSFPSPFANAFGGHYQSITQKIMKKNLGNGARKLLESSNQKLAGILSDDMPIRVKNMKKNKKLKVKENEEMAVTLENKDGEDGQRSDLDAMEKENDDSDSSKQDDGESSMNSDPYGGEEPEYEQEMIEQELEIEKQKLLDIFVEDVSDQILLSTIPEDQQHLLVKILTKQHIPMLDQLKMNLEDAAAGYDGTTQQEEMQRVMESFEMRVEDFKETMDRVQSRFSEKKILSKNQQKSDSSLIDDPIAKALKDQEKSAEMKAKIIQHIIQQASSDDEMNDQTEEALATEKNESGVSCEQIPNEFENQPVLDNLPNAFEMKNEPFIDAEMIKSAEIESNTIEQPASAKNDEDQFLVKFMKKQFEANQENLESMLEKELLKQDKKIMKAFEKEQQIRQSQPKLKAVEVITDQIVEQTDELLQEDLEELIKQQGEDIDFEFYFNGKKIQPNQTVFEILKEQEDRKRQQDLQTVYSEQQKQYREEESFLLSKLAQFKKKIGDSTDDKAVVLKEVQRLNDMLIQLQSQIRPRAGAPPINIYSSLQQAHQIYFCIKDKVDDVADLKRQRLDSLTELTNQAFRRSRTKSEAIIDISSQNINQYVQQILQNEFKVFDQVEEKNEEKPGQKKNLLGLIEEEQEQKDEFINSMSQQKKLKDQNKFKSKNEIQKQEKNQVEQSLKILKVLNFLFTHQDLISNKGIRFIMKANNLFQLDDKQSSPSKIDTGTPQKDGKTSQEGFSDFDLKSGFADIQPSYFIHQKLDSYLQKSIKDPQNLVQGAISANLQQIFKNCPFLFPFQTKELYFKLVSFIGAIDAHRSIYFLRQFIKQQGGAQKLAAHEKDNLKKIAKQKVVIHRGKLIESAFQIIQKIDKRSFLEFEFHGEQGVGLGPTLEFYDNIAEDFKNWKIMIDENIEFSMFRLTIDNLLFPSPVCIKSFSQEKIKQIYDIYRLCGTIIAKSIVDDRQIDLPISPLFWKLCLGQQMSIFDIQKLDETIFNTLAEFQIISNKADEILKTASEKNLSEDIKKRQLSGLTIQNSSKVEDYALDFTMPCFDHIELIQNGKDRDVTLENAQDYVDLVLHFTFHETVKMQIQAFKKGFNAIFPISSMAPFTHSSSSEEEIEHMVCGINCNDSEWQNKEQLMKYIIPDHGYSKQSQQYLNFIRYISEMDAITRPMFMKFLTGSKRLPIGGFKNMQPNLKIVLKKEMPGQSPDTILPSVMTCQNYVKCPNYTSYHIFKLKFDKAVSEGQQIFAFD